MEESKEFLKGERFSEESNIVYKVPISKLPKRLMIDTQTGEGTEVVDFEDATTLEVIAEFIRRFKAKQLPRMKELKRYYDAKNNIKYRTAKAENRADNRIASDFAKFDVTFKRGVLLGNPVKYAGDKTITDKVQEFSKRTNEDYHNNLMAIDMLTYGKAFELIHRDEFGNETITKLSAQETFVIYDTSMNRNSIVGVNFYDSIFLGETKTHAMLYANDGYIYECEFSSDHNTDLKIIDRNESYFDAVQVNEWNHDDESKSDFEAVMDQIDAYDLSISEMANFQQDSSDAYLLIVGNPDTGTDEEGENSSQDVINQMLQSRILVLGDKKIYEDGTAGAEPDAKYLTKSYDVQGVEAHNDRLVADILRFTALIDFTDENIGGNQSGIGFRFKGWGSDNDRKNLERQIKKALMRRLRLLTHSWSIKESIENQSDNLLDKIKKFFTGDEKKRELLFEKVNDIEIQFTPNVPQSDEEIMNVIKGMAGEVSQLTIFEMASRLTGVSSEEEAKRMKEENDSEPRIFDNDLIDNNLEGKEKNDSNQEPQGSDEE